MGVQTFMRVADGCITTEQPNRYPLLEQILSPANLNAAYKQVMRNKGAAGIDRIDCDRLLGYLLEHKDALTESIRRALMNRAEKNGNKNYILSFNPSISLQSSFVKAKHFFPRSFIDAPIRNSSLSSIIRKRS